MNDVFDKFRYFRYSLIFFVLYFLPNSAEYSIHFFVTFFVYFSQNARAVYEKPANLLHTYVSWYQKRIFLGKYIKMNRTN